MSVIVSLVISIAVLLIGILVAVYCNYSKMPKKFPMPFQVITVTVFVAAVALFVPMYAQQMGALGRDSGWYFLKVLLLSIHNTIRLFIVDGEFNIISDYFLTAEVSAGVKTVYTVVAASLFVAAPVLTFSAILSLFRSAMAQLRYKTSLRSKIYIFSELNEKALAVAKSLYEKDPKVRLVFTDVYHSDEEENSEFASEAKHLKALLFKKDITALNFYKHAESKEMTFFLIGKDESENLEQALWLVEKYKYRDNTNIYLFSTSPESEFVFSSLRRYHQEDNGKTVKVKLRRINEVQRLVNRNLYENGGLLFDNAVQDGELKKITAVIAGMGRFGKDMTKSLSWFCQMIGYRIEIHCFDTDEDIDRQFASLCPDLMNPAYNNDELTDEDARYRIIMHPGINVFSRAFDDALAAIDNVSYAFVALGDDEQNIQAAVKVRQLLEKKRNSLGHHKKGDNPYPPIQAVVFNSRKTEALSDVTNFKGEPLAIDFIGDIATYYSEKVIMGTEIEQLALGRHTGISKPEAAKKEEDFWRYEYNYRSSIASAIHKEMRKYCHLPGADKAPAERDWETERVPLRMLEHRRWCAYMRSEGYTYAPVRYDLAKQHCYLVNYSDLNETVQGYDDV